MLKELSHYGSKVVYQIIDVSFKAELKKNGIEYIELPDLEHDVIYYKKGDNNRYALIVDGEVQTVYITDSIPLDYSWKNLISDCKGQLNGKAPLDMKTKARLIIDTAYQDASDKCASDVTDLFDPVPKPTVLDVKIALAGLGYSANDLLKMDHHDIDANYLKSLCN